MPKAKEKLDANEILIATKTYATGDRVVHRGERLRASDPAVDLSCSVPDGTPESEWPNIWEEMPEPPQHAPEIAVETIQIPPHRQVRSLVDVSAPLRWSPDSPGAKSGVPPPFARTQLRQGQLVDALHPIVREHVDWFSWPERHVLLEDIERLEQLEREEVR
jgi:hypothetical protein